MSYRGEGLIIFNRYFYNFVIDDDTIYAKNFLKTCSMAHLLSNNLSGMYGVYHDLFNNHYNIYKTHFRTDNETMVQLLL